jgi:4'-phosphopantetheinyl transferase EntD
MIIGVILALAAHRAVLNAIAIVIARSSIRRVGLDVSHIEDKDVILNAILTDLVIEVLGDLSSYSAR